MLVSEQTRLNWFVRVLALSTLFCLAVSWRLWLSRPHYPLIPIHEVIPAFAPPWDAYALAGFVLTLLCLVMRPRSLSLNVATIACFLFFFAQDQSRLWTSFYLQSLLFIVNATAIAGGERLGAARTLTTFRVIFAAVYFWAGVNKLNVHFIHEEFPWFVEPITSRLPLEANFLTQAAVFAALFEIAVGLGLLSRRFRKLAFGGALLMHAMIFFCIGPLRDQWNNSSWIWGQTMAVQFLVLFWGAPPVRLSALRYLRSYRYAPIALAIGLAVGAPALNGFNRWDSALSFNVYSGNVDYAEIHMLPGTADDLPDEIAEFVVELHDRDVLNLQNWSLHEFDANPYPETRIFKALMAKVCSELPEGSACLLVREKASWFSPKSVGAYDRNGESAPDLADYFYIPAVDDAKAEAAPAAQ